MLIYHKIGLILKILKFYITFYYYIKNRSNVKELALYVRFHFINKISEYALDLKTKI
jgi:hypothetical protein